MQNLEIVTEYSPFEYLLINIANAMGKDKLLFEERIDWVVSNASKLHTFKDKADEPAIYARGLIELNNIRKGKSTGFMMGLDATASGLQCLSVLSGCSQTASQVNLIEPNKRKDPYTGLVSYMNKYLPEESHVQAGKGDGTGLCRADLKEVLMVYYYGSSTKQEKMFGKDTIEREAFHKGLREMNPGAEDLREILLDSIEEGRESYSWTLPDGFCVDSKTETKAVASVEIDELSNGNGKKSTFTHSTYIIGKPDYYLALLANAIHSVDGYLCREMQRRMNHNPRMLEEVLRKIDSAKVSDRSELVSLRLANDLHKGIVNYSECTENQLAILKDNIIKTLQFPSAPLMHVHDEFKTYPMYIGQMRWHYRELLAEIADSNLATRMFREIRQDESCTYVKYSDNLGELVRQSRYALC